MFHELTGDPHDSSAVQSALRLQLRQARLAKKKPTCLVWVEVTFDILSLQTTLKFSKLKNCSTLTFFNFF